MRSFAAILLLLIFPLAADAQSVPPLVNYQGRLSNPDGSALATADYQLTFNIYDSATNSGGLVWGPQIFDGSNGVAGHGPKIPVVQGYFNVMLGPMDTNGVSLANAFNDTNRFVEITVATNKAISPRQQILTAPFAFNSAKLAGYDWSALLSTNDPTHGTLAGSRITPGSVSSNQLGAQSVSLSQLAIPVVSNNAPVGGIAISLGCGNWTSPTPATFTQVSNLTVTLNTTGLRPVEIYFVADAAALVGDHYPSALGACLLAEGPGAGWLVMEIVDETGRVVGVDQADITVSGYTAGNQQIVLPPASFRFVDQPLQAGPHTYHSLLKDGEGNDAKAYYIRMIAREL